MEIYLSVRHQFKPDIPCGDGLLAFQGRCQVTEIAG